MQKTGRQGGDFLHRRQECGFIGFGWFIEACDFSNKLQRSGANLFLRHRWVEIEKCLNISAHEEFLAWKYKLLNVHRHARKPSPPVKNQPCHAERSRRSAQRFSRAVEASLPAITTSAATSEMIAASPRHSILSLNPLLKSGCTNCQQSDQVSHAIILYSQSLRVRRTVSINVLSAPTIAFGRAKSA